MKLKLFLCLLILSASTRVFAQIKPIKDLKPTVILISLDGFRYDYLDKFQPKMLNKLAKEGVRAKWMTPSFPSKTFPNHYTVATGLYPEHHGIIENNIYDFGTTFSMSKHEEVINPRWWLGEPIWVTAEKQGQISASYFFPGTDTLIKNDKPEFSRDYNGKVPNDLRVDTILNWLDNPIEKRPTMLTLYFSDTDDAGHEFSPDGVETKYAAWNVDRNIERLYNGLKQRKIADKVSIIIVSDHGMATVDWRNATILDDYFDLTLAEPILYTHEIIQIFPKENNEDLIFDKLKTIKHATCWKKADIPARFHYNEGNRIAPIVCSTQEGWILTNREKYETLQKEQEFDRPRGGHGYDNQLESMRATFIAHGGKFKKNYVAEPFENVNVYNLMCKILGLKPAANDANRDLASELLRGK
jgi:predicted AlkP superfamily pyrophosphatase or phosphodiesterase